MRNSKKKKKSIAKKLIKILTNSTIIIALILLICHFLIEHFENSIFDILIKKIEENSGGVYSIKYDKVDFNLLKRGINIENLSVNPDSNFLKKFKTESTSKKILFKTTIPFLRIEGISILMLIIGKSLDINKLYIKDGELIIYEKKTKKLGMSNKDQSDDNKVDKKSNPLKKIRIKNLEIEKTSFKLIDPYKKTPIIKIPEISLFLTRSKIYLYPKTYISFQPGEFNIKEPTFALARGFYILKAKNLNFSKSSISISFLELMPRYKKYQFSRIKGYRTNRILLKIDNVIFNGIHFDNPFKNHNFHSELLIIKNPDLDIFRDKNIPRNPRPKKYIFPQQLLRELKFKLRIDNIKISKGRIFYSELAKNGRKPGKLSFTDIKLNMKNLTNYPELLKKKISFVLTGSTKLMDKSVLKAEIYVPVYNKKNMISFSGSLGKTNIKIFNSMLANNAHFRIDSGKINKLIFSAKADINGADGEMKFLYNNLKVSMLKKGGKGKKYKIFSFLTNTIIHKNNPTPGKPFRIGKISYKRKKVRSVFSHIWKSLLSGIKSSTGLKKSKRR